MRKFLWVAIIAAAVTYAPGNSFADRGSVRGTSRDSGGGRGNSGIDYQDISRRNTQRTERESRQKKEAEAAKKKAEEDKRNKERAERMKRYQVERDKRSGKSSSSSSDAAAKKPAEASKSSDAKTASRGPGKPAAAPKTTGGSYDPTTRQVTEVMLDAVKTQQVKFDRASAVDDPSIILLNPPRHDPADRKRAADITGIGRPL